jgi:hypothetical protein
VTNILHPYKKGKSPWVRYRHFAEFLHPTPEPCPDLTPQAAAHLNKLSAAYKLWKKKEMGKGTLASSAWHIFKVVITAQCLGMRRQEIYRGLALWGSEFAWETVDATSKALTEFPMWHFDADMGHVPAPVDDKYRTVFRKEDDPEKSWYLAMPESLKSAFDEWLLANEWDTTKVRILVDGTRKEGVEPALAWHHPKLDEFLNELGKPGRKEPNRV